MCAWTHRTFSVLDASHDSSNVCPDAQLELAPAALPSADEYLDSAAHPLTYREDNAVPLMPCMARVYIVDTVHALVHCSVWLKHNVRAMDTYRRRRRPRARSTLAGRSR